MYFALVLSSKEGEAGKPAESRATLQDETASQIIDGHEMPSTVAEASECCGCCQVT